MWVKKTDKKHIQQMTYHFRISIDVDSSLSDTQIIENMLEQTREIINNKNCRFILKSVTRNGDGAVERMSIALGTSV